MTDYEKACIIAATLHLEPEQILAKATPAELDFYLWWCRPL